MLVLVMVREDMEKVRPFFGYKKKIETNEKNARWLLRMNYEYMLKA